MTKYTFSLRSEFLDELAATVEREAVRQRSFMTDPGQVAELVPNRQQLEELITVGFWASHATEEGRIHPFKLSFEPLHEYSEPFKFRTPIPFSVENLVKLATGLSATEFSICVWHDVQLGLHIWGFTPLPTIVFTLTASEPGRIIARVFGLTSVLITGQRTKFIEDVLLLAMKSGEEINDLVDPKRGRHDANHRAQTLIVMAPGG